MSDRFLTARSVKEEAAFGFAFSGIVRLPINILLDIIDRRKRTGLREVRGGIRLRAGLLVDLRDDRVGQHALGDELVLEKLDRVLRAAILLDFGFAAIGVVGIGDGMAAIAVGIDLDGAGAG